MLALSLRDRVPNIEIRLTIKLADAVQRISILKWNWSSHIMRVTYEKWNRKVIEWRPRQDAIKSRERPPKKSRGCFCPPVDFRRWLLMMISVFRAGITTVFSNGCRNKFSFCVISKQQNIGFVRTRTCNI